MTEINLTPNQSGVAACIVDGMVDKDIARAVGCSITAASDRVRRLRIKLGAKNRIHLALILKKHAHEDAIYQDGPLDKEITSMFCTGWYGRSWFERTMSALDVIAQMAAKAEFNELEMAATRFKRRSIIQPQIDGDDEGASDGT